MKNVSRRDFVKGSGIAAAAGATMLGLAPCAGIAEEAAVPADFVMDAAKADAKWSFEIAPEPIPEDAIADTQEADVIVVGCGTSGLCTAVSAVEAGASVILFSASLAPCSRGGSNHATHSKIMEREGIESYDVDRYIDRERYIAGNAIDQKKVNLFLNNNEEAMNWLVDMMDAKGVAMTLESSPKIFGPDDPLYTPIAAHTAYDDENAPGGGQPLIVAALADIFVEKGGTLIYGMKAEQLVRGGVPNGTTGAVEAVIASSLADGTYTKFVGKKGIVLATGDFSANKEMVRKYCPRVLPLIMSEGNNYDAGRSMGGLYKGDGHRMALWAGAGWQRTPNTPMILTAMMLASDPYINHSGLNVNINGERFMNECTGFAFSAEALLLQPERTCFAIWATNYAFDRAAWQQRGAWNVADLTAEETLASWERYAEFGRYTKADTLEELVAALGLPVEETLATIARYNELAEKGVDEDFHKRSDELIPIKEGPFYGSAIRPSLLTVLGGPRTNADLQICEDDDTPIEGLYCVGTMIGDYYNNTYTFLVEGLNYGSCITFGYLLGKKLAQA
ncbi:MAG: FAD-binding protein [Coriobacteriales bacterium]|nr:FAD-binding protein [Coriobacteriales bacterium]